MLSYVIFADRHNAEAKSLQADTVEQIGYGAENGTGRNFSSPAPWGCEGNTGTPTQTKRPRTSPRR